MKKVICINDKYFKSCPFPFPVFAGEYTPIKLETWLINGKEILAYELTEFPPRVVDGETFEFRWSAKFFAEPSEIDETEMERNYHTEKVTA